MLQLIGHRAYGASKSSVIDHDDVKKAIDSSKEAVGTMLLGPAMKEMTTTDIKFLRAMAVDEGESRIADIAGRMRTTDSNAGQYRRRLIALGIITPAGRGKVAMCTPLLREWIREWHRD